MSLDIDTKADVVKVMIMAMNDVMEGVYQDIQNLEPTDGEDRTELDAFENYVTRKYERFCADIVLGESEDEEFARKILGPTD